MPLVRLFLSLLSLGPGLKRAVWQRVYDRAAREDLGGELLFMNYGYDLQPPIELSTEDQPHAHRIGLYEITTRSEDLTGRRVLEVGCGRGGGVSYLARYRGPAEVVGLDLAPEAIARCRERHALDGVTFVAGDAEALPFEDGAFDVVVNIESTHCYPHPDAFLAEVERVLAPGGALLWADLWAVDRVHRVDAAFANSGLAIEAEEVITPGVLRSLDANHDRSTAILDNRAPWWARPLFRSLFGLRGSGVYTQLADGRIVYRRRVARKPA